MQTESINVNASCQTSLEASVQCAGVGLHSGVSVVMTIHPKPAGTGIIFRRTDISTDDNIIPARYDWVSDTRLCTVLTNEAGVSVGTVEHLMAALAGCGVDNVCVDIDGPEVPIMDGSAAPFVEMIERAGVAILEDLRQFIRILEPIVVEKGATKVGLYPHEGCVFECEIDFSTPVIGHQKARSSIEDETFIRDVLASRTFGFLEDLEAMKEAGLVRGGSLDNAIVISGGHVLNTDGLRHSHEFVHHKLLDAMGDLFLAAMRIQGLYRGIRPGHAANNALLRALFMRPEAWDIAPMLASTTDVEVRGKRIQGLPSVAA
ncbi:MAG: UDP-3-O-acyl-N-acetylglucosamine deacetylase [Parvularculales bacterium]